MSVVCLSCQDDSEGDDFDPGDEDEDEDSEGEEELEEDAADVSAEAAEGN